MSDDLLRNLERLSRSSRSVEDEAKWLGAKIQAGELSRDRLAFAAFLGHEASRIVLQLADPDLPALKRLRRVVRGGIRLPSGECAPIPDLSVLQAWTCDCAERVLSLATPHEEPLREQLELGRRAAHGETLSDELVEERRERLGQMAGVREERGWRSARMSVLGAFDICRPSRGDSVASDNDQTQADRRRKRKIGQSAFETAKYACEAVLEHTCPEMVDQEASWQVSRLIDHLLGRAGPLEPMNRTVLIQRSEEIKRDAPAPTFAEGAEVFCHFSMVAELAVLPVSLRQAIWPCLSELAKGDEASIERISVEEANQPGWFQLHATCRRSALDPRGWLDRAKGHSPPEAFLLLFQPAGLPAELVLLNRWRWLQVERRFGMDGGFSISSRTAQASEEELPSPPVDAWSLMGEHAWLEPQKGLTVQALREASEHLAGVLDRWDGMSEAEQQAILEPPTDVHAKRSRESELARSRAARVPELQAKSAEVIAGRDLAREGATFAGTCPHCSQEADLRVFASQRFVLCYPCYFDWW